MRGSIQNRGRNTWYLRISLGTDKTTGKRNYHTQTYHGRKKDAEKVLRDLVSRYESGGVLSADKQSLNAWLAEWMEISKRGKLSPAAFENYKKIIRLYIAETIGPRPLSRIANEDVQRLYLKLSERGLSPASVRKVHSILHQALGKAVKLRKLGSNPAAETDKPQRRKKRIVRSFTFEQAQLFLATVAMTHDSAMFTLALISGMRPGEILGLEWKHVDWKGCRVRVAQALVKVAGRPAFLGPPKTEAGYRSISLPPEVIDQLREHQKHQQTMKQFAGKEWKDNDLVFPNTRGGLGVVASTGYRFKKYLDDASLPSDFRLYDLRHTMATLLLLAGENPKVVSERLGHASIKITLDIYSHVLPDMQQQSADKFVNMFYRPDDPEDSD